MYRLLYFLAVLVSFGALGGMVFWGLTLSERNSDTVTILTAPEGPARIKSDIHGGREFAFQDLSLNTIHESGTAAKPADRVVLAPQEQTLLPEDGPGLTPAPNAAAPSGNDTDNNGHTTDQPVIRPLHRTDAAPDPSPQTPQGRTVDLGGYQTAQIAQAKWQVIKDNHAKILRGKQVQFPVTQNNGASEHRLQISGFATLDDVNSFCILMLTSGQECDPVQTP